MAGVRKTVNKRSGLLPLRLLLIAVLNINLRDDSYIEF